MKIIVIRALVACLLIGPSIARAQEPSSGGQADNTKVNERDRQASAPTADQQQENSSDRELAQKIRRAIVKDDSLSTYAHNVKVIVQDGTVTLKGPVRSRQERQAVEAKASAIAGAGKVTNQLEIAPEQN